MMTTVRNARFLTSQLTRKLSRNIPRSIPTKRMFSTSTDLDSHRMYTSNGHYWIRAIKSNTPNIDANTNTLAHFEIGLTQNVLDNEIRGTVDKMNLLSIGKNEKEKENENENENKISLYWSGLEVGTGDELYHSVWKNLEGIFTVEPFLPIRLKDLNVYEYNLEYVQQPSSVNDDWLFKLSCDQKDLGLLSGIFKSLRIQKDHDIFCNLNSKLVLDEIESYNK